MNLSTDGVNILIDELRSRSVSLVAFESTLYIVISLMALVGNLLTLWIIFKSPVLRTGSTNFFIASLAVSDFLMGLLSMHLLVVVLVTSKWPFGDFVCQYQGYVAVLLATSSTQILAWTAVNRYIRVCKSSHYNHLFTERKTKLIVVQICVTSLIAPLPYLLAGHKFVFNPGKFFCYLDIGVAWFTALLVAVYVGVPTSVILFCYFKVYKQVNKHNKAMSQHRAGSQSLSVEDIRMTHTLFVIVIMFIFCWTPVMIVDIIDTFKQKLSLSRTVYCCYTFLASISYAVNPVIYGIMNPSLRRQYYAILSCNMICQQTSDESRTENKRDNLKMQRPMQMDERKNNEKIIVR